MVDQAEIAKFEAMADEWDTWVEAATAAGIPTV